MRTLKKNQKTIYYALYSARTAIVDANGLKTGEYTNSYGTPVSMKANVSASKGTADVEMFGINTNYSKTVVTDDMSCPINEESILWIDTATTNPHNYVVVQVAKSINSITYAVRKVDVNANS